LSLKKNFGKSKPSKSNIKNGWAFLDLQTGITLCKKEKQSLPKRNQLLKQQII